MLTELMDISLLYVLALKQQLQKLTLLWFLILPFQMFCLMIIFVNASIEHSDHCMIAHLLQAILSILSSPVAHLFCQILSVVVSGSLFILFCIYMKIKQPFGSIDRFSSSLNLITLISALLIIVSELFLPITVYHIKMEFLSYSSSNSVVENYYLWVSPLVILNIAFTVYLNYQIRMLGFFIFIFPLFYD